MYHQACAERGVEKTFTREKAREYYEAAKEAERKGIRLDWWLPLLAAESGFRRLPWKIGDGVGIAQLCPATARIYVPSWRSWTDAQIASWLAGHPAPAVRIAGLYFADCLQAARGSYEGAVKMYNGGLNCRLDTPRAEAHLARVKVKREWLLRYYRLAEYCVEGR